MTIKGLKSF